LFDLPNLSAGLRRFLAGIGTPEIMIVPGGGAAADAIRALDRVHQLGEEASHWLALRAVSLNAWFLHDLLGEPAEVASELAAVRACWRRGVRPILDGLEFARTCDCEQRLLPHSWDATSDSLAAVAARLLGAKELVLLKSRAAPGSLEEASRAGLVDRHFLSAVGPMNQGEPALRVSIIDFRDWQ
jgi:aspartokinase-like uncharacterized kinase